MACCVKTCHLHWHIHAPILGVITSMVYNICNLLSGSFYLSYLPVSHEHLMNFVGFILTTLAWWCVKQPPRCALWSEVQAQELRQFLIPAGDNPRELGTAKVWTFMASLTEGLRQRSSVTPVDRIPSAGHPFSFMFNLTTQNDSGIFWLTETCSFLPLFLYKSLPNNNNPQAKGIFAVSLATELKGFVFSWKAALELRILSRNTKAVPEWCCQWSRGLRWSWGGTRWWFPGRHGRERCSWLGRRTQDLCATPCLWDTRNLRFWSKTTARTQCSHRGLKVVFITSITCYTQRNKKKGRKLLMFP